MKRLMDKVLGLRQVIDGVDRLSYDLNKKGLCHGRVGEG